MFSSLPGMSGGGHFSGNMQTFFIRHNSFCKPIALSWQGAPWKHVHSYIKFAILTFALLSSGGGGACETEWERKRETQGARESEDKRSYREEISKDNSNFLMESPEAGYWYTSEEEDNRNNGSLGGEETRQRSRVAVI